MYRMIIIPLVVAAFFVMLGCFSWKPAPESKKSKKKEKEPPPKQPNVFLPFLAAFAEIAFFMLYRLLHHLFMAGDDYLLPKSVCILFCMAVDAVVLMHMYFRGTKWMDLAGKIAILAVVLFYAEFGLFNAKSFTTDYQTETVGSEAFILAGGDTSTEVLGDHIVIKQNATVEIRAVPEWAKACSLHLEQADDHRPFHIKMLMEDDNFQISYAPVGNKLTSTYGRDVDFTMKTFGSLYAVKFEFSEMDTPVDFYSITCSNKLPFHFNGLRYIALFVVLGLIITVLQLRLHEVVFDPKNKRHLAAFAAVTVLCTCSAFFMWIPDQNPISYPDKFDPNHANPYEQTFDAFQNGQIAINVELDPQLASLGENLYDRSVRDDLHIDYAWDRAYYNGKLYSYFGVAPVLTFYFPYYWIKGGLPTMATVNFWFSFVAILFLCLTLFEIVKRYCPRANLVLFLLFLPVATMLSGDYYFLQYPNQYNIVVAAGFCYLLISMWAALVSLNIRKPALRLTMLAVCGIFCVLSAASRPCMVVGEVVLLPAFFGMMADRGAKKGYRIAQAAAVFVPVMAGLCGMLAYNAARFSAPFDFGESYQLTVSNIKANGYYISELPAAIYHYFLQPGVVKNVFPYFTYSVFNLDNYGMFKYYEIMFGLFNFPILPLGCIMLPVYLKKRQRPGADPRRTEAKAFAVLCLVVSVLLAWVEFCKGGASIRYQMDLAHLMVFLAAVVLLTLLRRPKRYLYLCTVIAIALSLLIKFLMMIHITKEGYIVTTLITQHPTWHEILEDMFIFWD